MVVGSFIRHVMVTPTVPIWVGFRILAGTAPSAAWLDTQFLSAGGTNFLILEFSLLWPPHTFNLCSPSSPVLCIMISSLHSFPLQKSPRSVGWWPLSQSSTWEDQELRASLGYILRPCLHHPPLPKSPRILFLWVKADLTSVFLASSTAPLLGPAFVWCCSLNIQLWFDIFFFDNQEVDGHINKLQWLRPGKKMWNSEEW